MVRSGGVCLSECPRSIQGPLDLFIGLEKTKWTTALTFMKDFLTNFQADQIFIGRPTPTTVLQVPIQLWDVLVTNTTIGCGSLKWSIVLHTLTRALHPLTPETSSLRTTISLNCVSVYGDRWYNDFWLYNLAAEYGHHWSTCNCTLWWSTCTQNGYAFQKSSGLRWSVITIDCSRSPVVTVDGSRWTVLTADGSRWPVVTVDLNWLYWLFWRLSVDWLSEYDKQDIFADTKTQQTGLFLYGETNLLNDLIWHIFKSYSEICEKNSISASEFISCNFLNTIHWSWSISIGYSSYIFPCTWLVCRVCKGSSVPQELISIYPIPVKSMFMAHRAVLYSSIIFSVEHFHCRLITPEA